MTRDFAGLVGRAERFDARAGAEGGQSTDELEQSQDTDTDTVRPPTG
jgi:hypothetical protein